MKQFLLAILSGVLLGIPFIAPQLWPFVLVGLAPLLFALSRTSTSHHAFALGLLTGVIFYGIALWAIFWHALPLDWLGALDVPFQIVLVAFCWSMTVLGCAVWTGVFGLAFSRIANNSWRDILAALALWVIAEWLSAWWFGIQNFGTGSILGPHSTLAFLGNALARDEVLVQLAWVGGVYALSAFAAGAGALAYRMASGFSDVGSWDMWCSHALRIRKVARAFASQRFLLNNRWYMPRPRSKMLRTSRRL